MSLGNKTFAAVGHIAGEGSFAGLKKQKLRGKNITYVNSEMRFQITCFLEGTLTSDERTDEVFEQGEYRITRPV